MGAIPGLPIVRVLPPPPPPRPDFVCQCRDLGLQAWAQGDLLGSSRELTGKSEVKNRTQGSLLSFALDLDGSAQPEHLGRPRDGREAVVMGSAHSGVCACLEAWAWSPFSSAPHAGMETHEQPTLRPGEVGRCLWDTGSSK